MKHIIAAFALLFASLSWAQPPVNIDSASTQEQNLQSRINSADTAAAAEQQPAIAAAPAPQDTAPTPDGTSALLIGALALLSIVAIAVAIAAWAKAKAAKRDCDHEISALKEALKQRTEELDRQLRYIEGRVGSAEMKIAAPQRAVAATPRHATAEPRHAKSAEQKPTAARKLYLSRADERGAFIAASAHFEPGNSIFLLTVGADGASGTFEVIADDGVHQLALMMPTESLTRACTGPDIQISAGKRHIVTDAPGTATKRGGQWSVATPAVIHYE